MKVFLVGIHETGNFMSIASFTECHHMKLINFGHLVQEPLAVRSELRVVPDILLPQLIVIDIFQIAADIVIGSMNHFNSNNITSTYFSLTVKLSKYVYMNQTCVI